MIKNRKMSFDMNPLQAIPLRAGMERRQVFHPHKEQAKSATPRIAGILYPLPLFFRKSISSCRPGGAISKLLPPELKKQNLPSHTICWPGTRSSFGRLPTLAPEAMRRPFSHTLDQGAKNRRRRVHPAPTNIPFDTATLAVTGQKPPPPGDRGKQAGEKAAVHLVKVLHSSRH